MNGALGSSSHQPVIILRVNLWLLLPSVLESIQLQLLREDAAEISSNLRTRDTKRESVRTLQRQQCMFVFYFYYFYGGKKSSNSPSERKMATQDLEVKSCHFLTQTECKHAQQQLGSAPNQEPTEKTRAFANAAKMKVNTSRINVKRVGLAATFHGTCPWSQHTPPWRASLS